MKKTLTLLSLLFAIGFGFQANASNYKIDQNQIDQIVAKADIAPAVSVFDLQTTPGMPSITSDKDPVVAFVLCTVLGGIGIHRLYLGTEPLTFVLYVITAGGCGIVAFVDWIMLLMAVMDNSKLSPYINNPNFFMWTGQIK